MWKAKIFKTLIIFLLPLLTFAENPAFKLKIYLPFGETEKSVKSYPEPTAQFLGLIAERLKEYLINDLREEGVSLYFRNGIGSDYTLFFTFPQASIYKISQYSERGNLKLYRYGYRIDLTLAVYLFTSSDRPRLVYYKTYRVLKYHPPSGEYLPFDISLAEAIAEALHLKIYKDLCGFVKKEQKKLQYYENLGK